MFKKDVTIVNELGLHARAAAQLAKIAEKAGQSVWLFSGDKQVDATSVIDILTLACAKGETVTITVDADTDTHILESLVALIESGFGE